MYRVCLLSMTAWVIVDASSLSAKEPLTIVAFGDSTTAKRGPLRVYPDVLQQSLPNNGLPVNVINAGIGGHHTNNAKARFENDVVRHAPDIVIIQFGINDSAVDVWKNPPATEPRIKLTTYVDNLSHFVHTLRKRNVKVVLMTPNPIRWTEKLRTMYGKPPYKPDDDDGFNVLLKEYAKHVRRLASNENVVLVDAYAIFEEFGEQEDKSIDDLLLDGMHPNTDGHKLIATALATEILKLTSNDR